MRDWTFLTNHGVVFLHLAENKGDTIRQVSDKLGLAERTVAGIVADLRDAGYLVAERRGTQNIYTINPDLAMRHPSLSHLPVGAMLGALTGRRKTKGGAKRNAA